MMTSFASTFEWLTFPPIILAASWEQCILEDWSIERWPIYSVPPASDGEKRGKAMWDGIAIEFNCEMKEL